MEDKKADEKPGGTKEASVVSSVDDAESAAIAAWLNGGGSVPPPVAVVNSEEASAMWSATALPPKLPSKMVGVLKPAKLGVDTDTMLESLSAASAPTETGEAPQQQHTKNPHHRPCVSWEEYPNSEREDLSFRPSSLPPRPNLSPKLSSPPRNSYGYSDDTFTGLGSPGASYIAQPELGSPKASYLSVDQSRVVVNLNDVLQVNPLESEAETLLLKAIERQDAINRRTSRVGAHTENSSTLFGNIPAESVSLFSSPSEGTENNHEATANRAGPGTVDGKPPESSNNRNKTMEQTLAILTNAMSGFNRGDLHEEKVGDSRQGGADALRQSAAESFAQNANILFRRPQKSERKNEHGADGGATDAGGHPNKPSRNWDNRRSSVTSTNSEARREHAATALTQSGHVIPLLQASESVEIRTSTERAREGIQEDVELGLPDEFDENHKGSSGGGNGVGSSKRKGRWMPNPPTMVVSKGAVQDFQVFVVQRRGSFFSYMRFLLLVVIPAFTVAFVLFNYGGKLHSASIVVVHVASG
jgi:hypothetical protein